jgi:GGDEF domain-containing protein
MGEIGRTLDSVMTQVDMGWLEIERARYETLLDPETRLPRWGLFIDRTAVALARARRARRDVAVFVLDDPRFPHGPCDMARAANLLGDQLRPDDTLARLGPNRFGVVCNEIGANEDAAQVARRLVYDAGLVCGLGVALGGDADAPETVIARALRSALVQEPEPAT